MKTGLQVLLEDKHWVGGGRVGLVTHPAAVLPDMQHALDALLKAGVNITTLFGPEHGFWGFEADAQRIADTVEPRTGLPAYSLYGDAMAPSAEMLEHVDVLLFDMQDVGARFYTYISTLFYILKAGSQTGIPVIVLDRPNPLGGEKVEGPIVQAGFESFIGIAPLPVVHGMTTAEIARWMNDRCTINADLKVVPMLGWTRAMSFEQTGLLWVPTSPAMPHLDTVKVFPATCMLEGTNLSEGRGTPLPFEILGAPWLDAFQSADWLNELDLPGVLFRPTLFRPAESKWTGEVCKGVQLHITDPNLFQPLLSGISILQRLMQGSSELQFLETSWEGTHPHFDLLMGNEWVCAMMQSGVSAKEISAEWRAEETAFREEREPYLLYS